MYLICQSKMPFGKRWVNSTTQKVAKARIADQIPTMAMRNRCGMPMYSQPNSVLRMSWPREYFS
jgi:hypothetical protein